MGFESVFLKAFSGVVISCLELPYIYRSEAKSGTNSFYAKRAYQKLLVGLLYAYVTLYVITNNKRVTLASKGVRRFDTNVAIITYKEKGAF